MSPKRQPLEPETRVGYCCGDGCGNYALLFKVPGIFRYRCSECFQRETGYRHHMAALTLPARVQP